MSSRNISSVYQLRKRKKMGRGDGDGDAAVAIMKRPAANKGRRSAAGGDTLSSQKDIEFLHHNVSIVRVLGEFGPSHLYAARDDNVVPKAGKWRQEQHYLVKATAARTQEEALRAQTEVKLFRKLRPHPNLVTLIDCGFSTIQKNGEESGKKRTFGDGSGEPLPNKRLYCYLFEPCPDRTLAEFIAKRAKKARTSNGKGLFGKLNRRRDMSATGQIHPQIIMEIFSQMCAVVKELQSLNKSKSNSPVPEEQDEEGNVIVESKKKRSKHGILHLDLQPGRFVIRKRDASDTSSVNSGKRDDSKTYDVKLISFGCVAPPRISLRSTQKREYARRMIESATSLAYRAPEMLNLHLHEELNDKADIWGLGCCLYELLFLKQAFGGRDEVTIGTANYEIPQEHHFDNRILELLGRMLEVNPALRPDISEVCDYVDHAMKDGFIEEGTLGETRKKSGRMRQKPQPQLVGDEASESEFEVSMGSLLSASGQHAYSDTELLDTGRAHHDLTSLSGTAATDGSSSDVASETTTHWIEFDANAPTSTIRKDSGSSGSRRVRRDRRRLDSKDSTRSDPLNLGRESKGNGSNRGDNNRLTDWTMGFITALSSRNLSRIEVSDTESVDRTDHDLGDARDEFPESTSSLHSRGPSSMNGGLKTDHHVGGSSAMDELPESSSIHSRESASKNMVLTRYPSIEPPSPAATAGSILSEGTPIPMTPNNNAGPIEQTPVSALTLPATPISLPSGMSMRGMLTSPKPKSMPPRMQQSLLSGSGMPPMVNVDSQTPSLFQELPLASPVSAITEDTDRVRSFHNSDGLLSHATAAGGWSVDDQLQSPAVQSTSTLSSMSQMSALSNATATTASETTATTSPRSAKTRTLKSLLDDKSPSQDTEEDTSLLASLHGEEKSKDLAETLSTETHKIENFANFDSEEKPVKEAEPNEEKKQMKKKQHVRFSPVDMGPEKEPSPTLSEKARKNRSIINLMLMQKSSQNPTDDVIPSSTAPSSSTGTKTKIKMVDIPKSLTSRSSPSDPNKWNPPVGSVGSHDSAEDDSFIKQRGSTSITERTWGEYSHPGNWVNKASEPRPGQEGYEELRSKTSSDLSNGKTSTKNNTKIIPVHSLLAALAARKAQPKGQASSEAVEDFDLDAAEEWISQNDPSTFESRAGSSPDDDVVPAIRALSSTDSEGKQEESTDGTDVGPSELETAIAEETSKGTLGTMSQDNSLFSGEPTRVQRWRNKGSLDTFFAKAGSSEEFGDTKDNEELIGYPLKKNETVDPADDQHFGSQEDKAKSESVSEQPDDETTINGSKMSLDPPDSISRAKDPISDLEAKRLRINRLMDLDRSDNSKPILAPIDFTLGRSFTKPKRRDEEEKLDTAANWTSQFYLMSDSKPDGQVASSISHVTPPTTYRNTFEELQAGRNKEADTMDLKDGSLHSRESFTRMKSHKTLDSNSPPSDDEVLQPEVSVPMGDESLQNGSTHQSQESLDISIRSEDPLSKMSRQEIIAYHRFQRAKVNEEKTFITSLRDGENVENQEHLEVRSIERDTYEDYARGRYEDEERPDGPEPYSDDYFSDYYTEDDIPLEIEIVPDHARSQSSSSNRRSSRKSRKAKRRPEDVKERTLQ